MRRLVKILTSRVISIALSIVAQIVFLYLSLCNIASFDKFEPVMQGIALVIVIYIINKQEDPSYTIGWCVLILVFPVLGVMLYLLCAGRKMPKKLAKGTTQVNGNMADLLVQDENVLEERVSPHGKRYFWIGGKVKELEQENDSDIIAIEEGYITITPVNIDMTNNKKIEILKNELLKNHLFIKNEIIENNKYFFECSKSIILMVKKIILTIMEKNQLYN